MGQSTSRSMCCAARDKEAAIGYGGFGPLMGQFHCSDLEVDVEEEPNFLVFAPLWQKAPGGVGNTRRVALASKTQVRVYRIQDGLSTDDVSGPATEVDNDKPRVALENTLEVTNGHIVTSIVFCDEASSKNIAVAFGAGPATKPVGFAQVRIWNLDMLWSALTPSHQQRQNSTSWTLDQGYTATLDAQQGPFTQLTTSPIYLFGALASGECIVWQKSSAYAKKGAAKLHQGGIEDMNADRNFLYTTGRGECSVSVWALPQLSSVFNIEVSLPRSLMDNFGRNSVVDLKGLGGMTGSANKNGEKHHEAQLCNVTALRLPLSRWAGSQGGSRTSKAPKGSIFVAAVLSGGSEVAGDGAGVLMHWTMGEQCVCRSAQIAHHSPIVAMVYGPYDNGPLVTADMYGTCRVWDNVPGLICSQQLELSRASLNSAVSFAVEPQIGLYSNGGNKRITVWRRDLSMPGPA
mmetsp:Transcript_10426/g.23626  ORF Transcript_10426/g.23626 Transcript_10426/m.23626 type:complete len:461 (-) Transcript_10426:66-1448(-)